MNHTVRARCAARWEAAAGPRLGAQRPLTGGRGAQERALGVAIGVGDAAAGGSETVDLWGATERQATALADAVECLRRLEDVVREGHPVDFWTIELRGAVMAIGQVTGEDVTEDVLGTIFAKFCIGK